MSTQETVQPQPVRPKPARPVARNVQAPTPAAPQPTLNELPRARSRQTPSPSLGRRPVPGLTDPTGVPPSANARMQAALGDYPGWLQPSSGGDRWRLVCTGTSSPLRVFVDNPRDLGHLIQELKLHAQAQPVWKALLNLPASAPDEETEPDRFRYAFIQGYLAAKPASLPQDRMFISVRRLDLNDVALPPNTDAGGFRAGLEAYVQGFWIPLQASQAAD